MAIGKRMFVRAFLARSLRIVREAWVIAGITLALLVAVELAARLVVGRSQPRAGRVRAAEAEVHATSPFVRELFAETGKTEGRWVPYVQWRRAPFQGTHVNIDGRGLRRTWRDPRVQAAAAAEKPIRIFMFGGSTLWGTGARDDFTIPSLVAKALARDRGDLSVEVVNFGESGWLATQGRIQLELELTRREAPDLAIFYDGVNEVLAAEQNGAAGLPMNEDNRRREFKLSASPRRLARELLRSIATESGIGRLLRRDGDASNGDAATGPGAGEALAEATAGIYVAEIALVADLAAARGFLALPYLQPNIWTKTPRSPFEEKIAATLPRRGHLSASVYAAIRTRAKAVRGFADLSGIFGDDPRPRFFDDCHAGEEANALIAEAIARDVSGLFPVR